MTATETETMSVVQDVLLPLGEQMLEPIVEGTEIGAAVKQLQSHVLGEKEFAQEVKPVAEAVAAAEAKPEEVGLKLATFDFNKLFPRYGQYGGPNYSSGLEGGNPLAEEATEPIDELDAIYKAHDIAYAQAKSNGDIIAADKVMMGKISGLLSDPVWSAGHPAGFAYGMATLPAFAAKVAACELGVCGLSSVSFGAEGDLSAAAPKVHYSRDAPALIKQGPQQVVKVLEKVFAPVMAGAAVGRAAAANDYDELGPRQQLRRKRAQVAQLADAARKIMMRAGDIESNPGPMMSSIKHTTPEMSGLRIVQQGDDITVTAISDIGNMLLMQCGDVERNPGPMNGLDQIEAGVDLALEIIDRPGHFFMNPVDIEADFVGTMDIVTPATASAVPLTHMEGYPPIGISGQRFNLVHNSGTGFTNPVNEAFVNSTVVTGRPSRKMRINPQLESIYAAVTGDSADASSLQQFFATVRSNFFRFNGQDLAEFFGTSLPMPGSDGTIRAGSASRQLAIALAWMSVNTHIDPYSCLGLTLNQYQQRIGPTYGSLATPTPGVPPTANAGYGVFPFTTAYQLLTDRVLAEAVTFGTFMKMQNANAFAGTAFAREFWEDRNFAIVPVVTGQALSNPGLLSMLVLTHIAHPYVVPTSARQRQESDGTNYVNLVADVVTNSAFHAQIVGPRPTTTAAAARTDNLYILFVVADVGSQNGASQAITLTVGSSTNSVTLNTSANPAAGTNIGQELYSFTSDTPTYIEAAAQLCFRDTVRLSASEECLRAATAWMAGITPLLYAPCNRVGAIISGPTSQFMGNGGASVPSWPSTDMGLALDAAADDSTFATNPCGALWAKIGDPVLDTMLATQVVGVWAILPQANVFGELALMMRWMQLASGPPRMKYGGLGQMCSHKVRLLQIKSGLKIASGYDCLAEDEGVTGDIWYDQRSGVDASVYTRPILDSMAEMTSDALGLIARYPFQVQVAQVTASLLTQSAPRRVPIAYCESELVPSNALVPLPTPGQPVAPIIIAGNPANLRLDALTRDAGKGQGWAEDMWIKSRSIAFTGAAGGGTTAQTLVSLCSIDGAMTANTISNWYCQLLDVTVWANLFPSYTRKINIANDLGVGNVQPWVDAYAGATSGSFRQLYMFTNRSFAAYFGGGGLQPAAWVIPQPPGGKSVLIVDPYVGIGNLNPFKRAGRMLGASREAAADDTSFLDEGSDVAASSE